MRSIIGGENMRSIIGGENMDEMKRVNIRITSDVYDWFKTRSEKTGVPMSALMFLALEGHVQQQIMIPHVSDLMKAKKEKESH